MAAPLANLGIFRLFFIIAVEDRFDQNINIRKWLLVKNFMLVPLVKKVDFCHSGCHQGTICAKKHFGQKGGLPDFFRLR